MGAEYPFFLEFKDYERIVGKPWEPRFFKTEGNDSRPRFNAAIKAAVWDKTKGLCFYCGASLNPWSDFSVDHVIPVSRGGTDDVSNLVPACHSCNSRKGATVI